MKNSTLEPRNILPCTLAVVIASLWGLPPTLIMAQAAEPLIEATQVEQEASKMVEASTNATDLARQWSNPAAKLLTATFPSTPDPAAQYVPHAAPLWRLQNLPGHEGESAKPAAEISPDKAQPFLLAAEGGYTNYIPGFYGSFGVAVTPDPGVYVTDTLYYYAANGSRERFVQFGEIRTDVDLDLLVNLVSVTVVPDVEVLGGRYAFGAFIPLPSYTDLSATVALGSTSASIDESLTAIGDLGVIPASLFWNFGDFYLNLSETITVPVGSYDVDRDVNASLNYWTFDTELAATYLNQNQGFEVSAVFGYLYNTVNRTFSISLGELRERNEAGQTSPKREDEGRKPRLPRGRDNW